jgi:hypothetical protein
MLSKKLRGEPGQFQAAMFSPTKWNTAQDKAEMANKITKFILNGFQRPSFKKDMYRHLSCMFGHIAEYDIHGFHLTWFDDDQACQRWVENVQRGGVLGFIVGDPTWTWSDVERAIQKWVVENHILEQIKNEGGYPIQLTTMEHRHTAQLTLF